MKLRYHLVALEDLTECWDYYDRTRSRSAANRVIEQIQKTCSLLLEQPGIGRRRFDLSSGLRSFPSGGYVVYYYVSESEETLAVVRVIHGTRDILGVEFPNIDEIPSAAELQ